MGKLSHWGSLRYFTAWSFPMTSTPSDSDLTRDEEYAKVVIRIPRKDNELLNNLIGWGQKTKLFTLITQDLITELKKDPQHFLASVFAGHVSLKDFVQTASRDELIQRLDKETDINGKP